MLQVRHRPRFIISIMSISENNLRVDYVEFPVTDIGRTKEFCSKCSNDDLRIYTSFHDGRIGGGFYASAKVDKAGPLVVIYATDLESILDKVTSAGRNPATIRGLSKLSTKTYSHDTRSKTARITPARPSLRF